MGANDFDREVLDRLITIETKLDTIANTCPTCQVKIHDLEIASVKTCASVKSAHLRIDGVYKTVAIVAAAITLFMNTVAFIIKQVTNP